MSHASPTLPTYYISHGGGPWPWVKDLMGANWGPLEASLEAIPRELGPSPKALLVISGHWEAPAYTVQTHPNPPMLYDYYGFPDFTYHISYPAPGAPNVAARAKELLDAHGLPTAQDADRGFDHGVFAPMYVAWPDATMPIVQLSLRATFDPAEHIKVGQALAPLRDEGVVIIGSGFSFHNLRAMGAAGREPSAEFDAWLTESVVNVTPAERVANLTQWESAPSARASHPREDHLLPLMVAAGAGGDDTMTRIYHESSFMGSITSSSYRFGDAPVP